MKINNIEIKKLRHATFKIIFDDKFIYLDPFRLPENQEKADYIFITHEHFDHCSAEDVKKILKNETKIITIESAKEELKNLTQNFVIVKPNQEFEIDEIKVKTIPAYNINKFRSPGVVFHPKEDGKVGFILEIKGIKIYHAGDTDFIEEMKELKGIDVALVPVSGTYVMTAEESADAVNTFQPKIAIPMHYGEIVGSIEDAQKFRELSKVEVHIEKV